MITKLSPEAKVGIFVFAGLVLLVYMSLRIGGMSFGQEEGYNLKVRLANISGLADDASVRIAGVEVGRVQDIALEDNIAVLGIRVKPDIRVGEDFTAAIRTRGLLGEKFLELVPGAPGARTLNDGEEIVRVKTSMDIEKLVGVLTDVATDVKLVTASLSNVLGGKEGEQTLRNIVDNIESITFRIDSLVARNDAELSEAIANLNTFSKSITEVADSLNAVIDENRGNFKDGIENMKTASTKLDQVLGAITEVTDKVNSGEGTIARLLNDPETHDNINETLTGINKFLTKAESFRTYVSYKGEYLFDAGDMKSYFSVKIQPKSDKFYLIEIVDDPRGSIDRKTVELNPGTTTEIITTKDEIKFSAQIAKRFRNTTFRGGLIESTGGGGLDYHMLDDKLRFSFDAFDFDDERSPHLKAGLTYNINKFIIMTGGYDHFLSDEGLESPYFGLGIRFEDEDLKYLLSSVPSL
ncbi:MAG: MCE family protein [Deltaproteobacteria bacterium]|nr:MCE family protein [Deltaproteobacteria bacterium]